MTGKTLHAIFDPSDAIFTNKFRPFPVWITPLPLPARSVQEIRQHFSQIRTWSWWPLNEGSTVFHITALDFAFTNTAKKNSFVSINHFNIVKIIMNNCSNQTCKCCGNCRASRTIYYKRLMQWGNNGWWARKPCGYIILYNDK